MTNRHITFTAAAMAFMLVDFAAFVVPLGSALLFYVAAMRPRWFYDAVRKLYED